MARRKEARKRVLPADQKFKDVLATRFINFILRAGKKSVAERIFYGAMGIVEEKAGQPAIKVLKQAFGNVKPVIEVKSRRVGGATYQVPVEVRADRRESLGIRWMLHFARERGGKSMQEKLAAEIMDAAKGEGGAVRKKEDTHRMAEANKAFAHYRW